MCVCAKCGGKKPSSSSWNHSFTLTWLRKMCADKLENVLVTSHTCIEQVQRARVTAGDYASQLDFYLITHKVDVVVKNWNFLFLLSFSLFFHLLKESWREWSRKSAPESFFKGPRKNHSKETNLRVHSYIDFTMLLTNDFETESKTFSLTIQKTRRTSTKKWTERRSTWTNP